MAELDRVFVFKGVQVDEQKLRICLFLENLLIKVKDLVFFDSEYVNKNIRQQE